jgi:CheY-like chemotaxis protein
MFADIELALGNLGVVTHASDGLDALRLLRLGLRPDVIVTDVIMPKMDGIALCRFVKNHPATARIPVVMFSSAAGAKDMVAGIAAGARQ